MKILIGVVGTQKASRGLPLAADDYRSKLLVVGARDLGTLGRLLLGITSDHLLTHAPCSVSIVRHHEVP